MPSGTTDGHAAARRGCDEVVTMGRLLVLASILLGVISCGGPQVPAFVAPTPCRVDEQGQIVAEGGRESTCCPKDYVAGGNSETNCPKGQCCPLTSDVNGRAPAAPVGPMPQRGPPQSQP
jgi:hypothetical protein